MSLTRSCRSLYYQATLVLWKHIKLDLTVSTTKAHHHLFDSTTSAILFNTLASNSVSPYALSCIRQLSLNMGTSTTPDFMLNFLAPRLLNPALLQHLRSVTFHGPTWNNIRAIPELICAFPATTTTVSIHDISLSCLAELALPIGPLNRMLTSLSLNFSSFNNKSSDIDLLSQLLKLLPRLHTFALSFNYEFDLCDDMFLESRISSLFWNMDTHNPNMAKISIYDFPPYLHFNPQCLPPSTKEFLFHTNEIDCELRFITQLLTSCRTKLTSLSLRIAQSIEEQENVVLDDYCISLTSLTELTLDVPCTSHTSLLATLIKANRQLSRIALSGLSTTGLCQLLHCRNSLRQLYIYSFAAICSPECPSLVIQAVMSHFPALRLLSLPPMPEELFQKCIFMKQQHQLPYLSLILSHQPFAASTFAYATISSTHSTPIGSPSPSPSLEQQDPANQSHQSPSFSSPLNLGQHDPPPLFSNNDRTALWTSLPFKSVDELDLFTFHNKDQICVL